jgi:hypothetical protein
MGEPGKVGRTDNHARSQDVRLKRRASSIEALAAKDEILLGRARDIAALRRSAAAELHRTCRQFVESVNRLLKDRAVELDPPEFPPEAFLEQTPNLIQINVRGRILQVAFESTPELVSTEDFRIPYTLGGTVHAFNQELLEKERIEEQLIFYTLEKKSGMWRFFDARTYRSGPFDQEYLIGLMEQLI